VEGNIKMDFEGVRSESVGWINRDVVKTVQICYKNRSESACDTAYYCAVSTL
jgi:hypothetical protein